MENDFILSRYIEAALASAIYDKLDDGSFSGRIPQCAGVIAFAVTLMECQRQLRSTFEEWILLGLKLSHQLPIIDGIDLNKAPDLEPLEAV